MYTKVISEDETSVSSSLSEQTSYQTVMFLMPLILDEFQSECDLTRDVQLARQAIEQGVLESVNADLRYTVMVTQVMEEEDSTIADETCAATIKYVANKYLNAHAFCLNEKMITFLWGDKSIFEKQLHLVAEEICQSFTKTAICVFFPPQSISFLPIVKRAERYTAFVCAPAERL